MTCLRNLEVSRYTRGGEHSGCVAIGSTKLRTMNAVASVDVGEKDRP